MSNLMTKVVNLILYQAGWFCCVLGAAWGRPYAGALAALLLVGVHLMLTEARRTELRMIAAACLLGVAVDSAQQALGVFSFRSAPGWPFWLPPWVFVIWAQFATLFRYALYWLSGRYLLGAALGMVGGPLAYWSGIRLGAARFGEQPVLSLVCLAMVWALATPLLLWISDRQRSGEGCYRWFATGR